MIDIARLQTRLAVKGFDPGPIDGVRGARTWSALFAFGGAAGVRAAELGRGAALHWPNFGIDANGLRCAHFMAQAAHESAGFAFLSEIWGPTSAQRGYEGRRDLGNTQPGDGRRYAGRGVFQLTGRANYGRLERETGLPLIAHPELAADPANSVWIACLYWAGRRMNPMADRDDVEAVTRAINGGKNGLPDRIRRTTKMKGILL